MSVYTLASRNSSVEIMWISWKKKPSQQTLSLQKLLLLMDLRS